MIFIFHLLLFKVQSLKNYFRGAVAVVGGKRSLFVPEAVAKIEATIANKTPKMPAKKISRDADTQVSFSNNIFTLSQ